MRLQYRFLLTVVDLDAFDPVVARSEELAESLMPRFLEANGRVRPFDIIPLHEGEAEGPADARGSDHKMQFFQYTF